MAESKGYILDGYRFNSKEDYEKGKIELDTISKIKSERDMTDDVELRNIYDTYLRTESFVTPVGVGFLREIQKRLAKDSENRKTMRAIPVSATVNKSEEAKNFNTGLEIIDNLKFKIKALKIVIIFLIIMVLVPFGIVIYDKASVTQTDELTDKYATWKEELQNKEKELIERENAVKERESNKNTNIFGGSDGERQNSGS